MAVSRQTLPPLPLRLKNWGVASVVVVAHKRCFRNGVWQSLDMCLSWRSWVSRLLKTIRGHFKFYCKTINLDKSWKWTILPNTRGINLKIQFLEVRLMSRPTIFLPWLTKLRFKTDVFEHMWPPLHSCAIFLAMNWENWPLVTDEHVNFKKQLVEDQDSTQI